MEIAKIPFRIKDSMKQRKLKFLNEMVVYYSEDVTRRAARDGFCMYLDKYTGNKCAIGRYIIDENSLNLEGDYDELIEEFPDCLPKEIKKLGYMFLINIQNLHDQDYYWCDSGLSKKGLLKVKILKERIKNGDI